MDEKLDLSALASSDGRIGDAVSKLLARPDLVMNIANELGLLGGEEGKEKEEKTPTSEQKEEKTPAGKALEDASEKSDRKKLLLALRPYLSESRREALDMMVSLESFGKILSGIDTNTLARLLTGGKNV